MAPVVHSRWNKAAGVPIFYPLVRHTGQQRGITSRPSSPHQGETEPACPSSPEDAVIFSFAPHFHRLLRECPSAIGRFKSKARTLNHDFWLDGSVDCLPWG